MRRTAIGLGALCVASLLAAPLVNGCSRAADRTLTIFQFQSTGDIFVRDGSQYVLKDVSVMEIRRPIAGTIGSDKRRD